MRISDDMKIKAVVFSLDDTLFDSSGQLRNRKIDAGVNKMKGLGINEEIISFFENEVRNETTSFTKIFEILKGRLEINEIDQVHNALINVNIDHITPFPDTVSTLRKLKTIKVIVSTGDPKNQRDKINRLNIEKYFDKIYIRDVKDNKTEKDYLLEFLQEFNLDPSEVMVVGDKPYSEIKIANELGMKSVLLLCGVHAEKGPKEESERPDHIIHRLSEILELEGKWEK